MKVVVIGAGPAGVMAALRAAELGAETTLVTRGAFGGMAATDGPVPVRTLAHAARLMRGVRSVGRYGITLEEPRLCYNDLLVRVREVVAQVRDGTNLRTEAGRLGVVVHENAGAVSFAGPRVVVSKSGLRIEADRFIVCAGGIARRLDVPGADLAATHSDAWSLTEAPPSILIVGGGMTGLQVASIFHAFGSRIEVFQRGPRILPDEDEDVSTAVAAGLREQGIILREGFGSVESFERAPSGVRMNFSKDGRRESAEASLALLAIGWVADAASLNAAAGGIAIDDRGFVKVDEWLRTSNENVFAAGDITGRSVLVPPAVLDAHVAATNAVTGAHATRDEQALPMGGFTDPEYAHVGMTEAEARRAHDAVVGLVRFDETTRTIIDGRTDGFCKIIVDRRTRKVLGCHVVGERAVEIVQAIAMAMAGGLDVGDVARMPLAFPTYVGILSRAAFRAARLMDAGPDLRAPLGEG